MSGPRAYVAVLIPPPDSTTPCAAVWESMCSPPDTILYNSKLKLFARRQVPLCLCFQCIGSAWASAWAVQYTTISCRRRGAFGSSFLSTPATPLQDLAGALEVLQVALSHCPVTSSALLVAAYSVSPVLLQEMLSNQIPTTHHTYYLILNAAARFRSSHCPPPADLCCLTCCAVTLVTAQFFVHRMQDKFVFARAWAMMLKAGLEPNRQCHAACMRLVAQQVHLHNSSAFNISLL